MSREMTMTEHVQVPATLPCGTHVLVDEDMRPLLNRMWEAGFDTLYSCQGNYTDTDKSMNVLAYIMFDGEDAAQDFSQSCVPFVGCTVIVDPSRPGTSCVRFLPQDVTFLGRVWEFS